MRRILAVLATAGVLVAGATPAYAETDTDDRTVISQGHVDLAPRVVDGAWRLQIEDGSADPPAWHDADHVVLQARDTARTAVPADPRFGFLGTPGSPVWLLPQSQQSGIVWPGWNTQDPGVAAAGHDVTWRVLDVDGPGEFTLFVSGNFGTPRVLFDGREELPQELDVEPGTHAHGNWAFSEPGDYRIDVEMAPVDGSSPGARSTLRVHVGDDDPTSAFDDGLPTWAIVVAVVVVLAAAVVAVLLVRRRRAGGTS
ncbi:choice-of-anchor M domain-containing protein [Pseudonocardia phyllosphaerae]|uniref:choice-of-anchor M domain-containing protein n=1 Tax=Pseudonocardia phyllosphaerae TaxID=3390502 RepID=UPI00397BA5B1